MCRSWAMPRSRIPPAGLGRHNTAITRRARHRCGTCADGREASAAAGHAATGTWTDSASATTGHTLASVEVLRREEAEKLVSGPSRRVDRLKGHPPCQTPAVVRARCGILTWPVTLGRREGRWKKMRISEGGTSFSQADPSRARSIAAHSLSHYAHDTPNGDFVITMSRTQRGIGKKRGFVPFKLSDTVKSN